MKKYIVYIKSTGQIVRFGTCEDSDFEIQAQDGQELMEGSPIGDSYIDNGNIVLIPSKPYPFYLFSYQTKQWYDPRTNETQWTGIRFQRDSLLASCDWTQLPDVEISTKSAWATYRQALRDITSQVDPFNIIWPTPPQG